MTISAAALEIWQYRYVLQEESSSAFSLLDYMQQLKEVTNNTEHDALTKARLGQGLFRHRVA